MSASARLVIVATLLSLTWGTFAFGGVYEWAYVPLAWACALIGLTGLVMGDRPAWSPNRQLFIALAGIGLIGALQIVPLSVSMLRTLSPGTIGFLAQYDFRFALWADPQTGELANLTHAVSVDPDGTILALSLLVPAVLFLVGLLRVLSRTGAARLADGIVVIGAVLALVGIVQKATLGDHAFGGMKIYGFWQPEYLLTTPFGPFVNKNHFAGWMLMGIPLALGRAMSHADLEGRRRDLRSLVIWLSEPAGGRTALYLVVAFLMTLSLLMTGSRSGLGCFVVVLCGAALWTGRHGGSWKAAAGAAAGVAALVVVALQWAGQDARLDRFVHDSESLGMRLDIWGMSLDIVRDFPLLGTGLNSFGRATVLYQQSRLAMHYNEAHNDYVQLLVEGGLVTGGLVLVAIVGVARAVRARFLASDDGRDAYWVRVGATTGLLAIALQALVEFSLQMPGNAALFVTLLALALYVPAQRVQEGDVGAHAAEWHL